MKWNSRGIVKGFTLIEILIAVAIIGILAAIAYPTYSEAMRKARRADAKSLLMEVAARQEQFFSSQSPNTYAAALTQLSYVNPLQTDGGWYTVTVASTNAAGVACASTPADPCTGFTLTATPQNDQAKDRCNVFRLNHFGAREMIGASLPAADCW